MEVLTLRPRLKKSGNHLKATWYCIEHGCDFSTSEILTEIQIGTKFDFDFSYDGKYKDQIDPYRLLLNLVFMLENCEPEKDTEFSKRIIINGGLIEYAKKLESKLGIGE